jgi:hypothetical protein
MFVARYVVEALPLPGTSPFSQALKLPVSKGYTPLLRRITYSLDVFSCTLDESDVTDPVIEIAIQSRNDVQIREGAPWYIGGIVIQPTITYKVQLEALKNRFVMNAWGTRAFMALEQRYVLEESYIMISTTNYDGQDTLGLRIEYTQEKLSDLEFAQANLR